MNFQRPRHTLESSGVLERGGNCFGFLRLALASLVIVSHTFTIGGFGAQPLQQRDITLGLVAVYGFFALSGALVAKSADGAPTGAYLWHRVRRIYPAYWVCLLVTGLAIAPLITVIRGLPWGVLSPHGSQTPYTYFTNNFLLYIQQPTVGHVVRGLPLHISMNGSIWSLAYEFTCYLIVFALVRIWIAAGRRNLVLSLALATTVVLAVFALRGHASAPLELPLLGRLDTRYLFPLLATFLVGSAMALWRDWVPFTPRIVAACGIIVVISVALHVFAPYGALFMPYLILGLGAYLPRALRPVGVKHDFSYGVYLYGMPAGQLLVAISVSFWTPATLVIASFVLAGVFAVASWFLVERWFLRSPTVRTAPQVTRR